MLVFGYTGFSKSNLLICNLKINSADIRSPAKLFAYKISWKFPRKTHRQKVSRVNSCISVTFYANKRILLGGWR